MSPPPQLRQSGGATGKCSVPLMSTSGRKRTFNGKLLCLVGIPLHHCAATADGRQ
jgi:hypothetical protein